MALYVAILYFMRWLIRGFEYAIFTILAIINLKNHQAIDFRRVLSSPFGELSRSEQGYAKKMLQDLDPKKLVHRVILPMYNESSDIIIETLSNLQKSDYSLKQIAITIA